MSDTKPSTVAEIKAMPEDATVFCFIGTIKARHKRSSGANNRGNWSFETLELRDADGGEIRAKFKDCEPLALNLVAGVKLSILAHKGDKGWTGSKAKDDEYPKDSGKFERILWVTPSAGISLQATPSSSNRQESSGHDQDKPTAGKTPDEALKSAIVLLSQLANLQRLCLRQTVHIAEEWQAAYGKPMSDDLFQSINSSFWIKCKDSDAFFDLQVEPLPIKRPSKGTK